MHVHHVHARDAHAHARMAHGPARMTCQKVRFQQFISRLGKA